MRCSLLALMLAAGAVAEAQTALPTAFGGITIGTPWAEVRNSEAVILAHRTDSWAHYARECGYLTARLPTGGGELLVDVQDHRVARMSFVTAIRPGTDVRDIANSVIETHGQPESVVMRDGFGRLSVGTGDVSFVTLAYAAEHPVEFTVAGGGVWQYAITVTHAEQTLLENRTERCARALARDADDD